MKHEYKGQMWCLQGYQGHTKKNGEQVVLRVWRSACAACGAPIECCTPMDWGTSRAFGLRYCPEHKAK